MAGSIIKRPEKMSKDKKIPDGVKIFLFRWWTAGACCFLGAFGTGYGAMSDPLDLIFLLAAIISAVMIFIFNPMMQMLYDVRRAGRIVNGEYRNQRLSAKIFRHIREIFKCYLVSFTTYMLYQGVNSLLVMVQGYDANATIIPVEPFLFGFLFSVFYLFFSSLSDLCVMAVRKRKEKKING